MNIRGRRKKKLHVVVSRDFAVDSLPYTMTASATMAPSTIIQKRPQDTPYQLDPEQVCDHARLHSNL